MNENLNKISKVMRYVGVAFSIITLLCLLFVLITNQEAFEAKRSFYYFSFLPFVFLYVQVWHIIRDLDKNLVEAILAHVIGIIYFTFTLLYIL